jgi:hypothetical protein
MTGIDAIGWIAALMLLAAYLLLALRRVDGHSARFHGLNVLGSAGLAANSAVNRAFPSAVLNVIWMAIGVGALVRHRGPRSRTAGAPPPGSR